jgi:hypothetical protein
MFAGKNLDEKLADYIFGARGQRSPSFNLCFVQDNLSACQYELISFFLLSIKPYSVGHHRFHLQIVIVEKRDRQFLAGVLYGSA